MIRELQTKLMKNTHAQYTAAANMKTGMGVIKDHANKKLGFPSADSATNIFIADHDLFVSGSNAVYDDFSDYSDAANDIAIDSRIKAISLLAGERYATDQFVADNLYVGCALAVGTDGKWKRAADDFSSKFLYGGSFNDNGHTLAIFEVLEDVIVGLSRVAALKEIKIGNVALSGFDAETLEYNVELTVGTVTVPTVTAAVVDGSEAVAVVTAATELPEATTITVTSEDGLVEQIYTINFTVATE